MIMPTFDRKEQQNARNPLPDIPMDAETKRQMAESLKTIVGPMQNVFRALNKWFQITLDEDRARKFIRAVSLLLTLRRLFDTDIS